jgi:hypothetical protein
MSLLDELVTDATMALHHLVQTQKPKSLTPIFFAVDAEGTTHVLATPWASPDEKTAALRALKAEFRKRQIIAYVHISEAWIAYVTRDDPAALTGRVADRPDKVEAVVMAATDGTDTRHQVYDITRDRKGRIVALALRPELAGMTDPPQGRMFELLEGVEP